MTETEKSPQGKAVKPNPVRVLRNYFATTYELINSQNKAYAVPRPEYPPGVVHGSPPLGVAVPLGAEMRREIVRMSAILPEVPLATRAMVDAVLLHLDEAAHRGSERQLALRFHHDPSARRVCLDLAQSDGFVVIEPDGWFVERNPPDGVLFRRSFATKPLPTPAPGGRLDELAGLMAMAPESLEFRAVLGWVLGLVFAQDVRPGLLLVGPYGAGKSTRLRLAASLLEPSDTAALGSAFGRNFGDDQVRALHRAVPLWDNLTAVSGAVSDELCTLVTGTARETRALYSDNELNVVPIARPLGLTAVGVPAGLRPDALDRLIVVEVSKIQARRGDAELQAEFDAAHPQLLGALCDAISAALAYVGSVPAASEHRMAHHARILAAVDLAVDDDLLPGCPGELLAAYSELAATVRRRTVAEDSFGGALLDLLEARQGQFVGKASELLAAAGMYAMLGDRGPGWPTSARRVPEVLNHLREGLLELGVTWSTTTVRGSTRYTFERIEPVTVEGEAHPEAHPLDPQAHPEAHPPSNALTWDNAAGGGRGGRGGLLPAPPLFQSSEKEVEQQQSGEYARSTPTMPTTPTPPTPAAAPPGEGGAA